MLKRYRGVTAMENDCAEHCSPSSYATAIATSQSLSDRHHLKQLVTQIGISLHSQHSVFCMFNDQRFRS